MQANGFSESESAITSGQPCRRLRRGLGAVDALNLMGQ
jgi:hypothetical protein